MSAYFTGSVCLECGAVQPPGVMTGACPVCGSSWLDARYDYAAVAEVWAGGALRLRPQSLWRYAELLPLDGPDPEVTLGEHCTPLLRLHAYERRYHHLHLYVKDERHGPTSSFKDRQAALTVTALRRAGIRECVLASTGNAAAAYAAYCARAGIKLWLFLASLVPAEKMREAALYGAEVVKVTGTYDETKQVAAEFARQRGLYFDRGARSIPGKESMKTLGFEIAEQLGLVLNPDGAGFRAPDWYIQAVSGGIGPLGVWKAFSELYTMGLIDRLPRLGIIQAAGCAPMVRAYEAGADRADPVVPETLIHVLATGDPGYSYVLLREAVMQGGGTMLAVEDGETFAAMRRTASLCGLSVEPAAAAAFAGLEKLFEQGQIQPGEVVVVNASGHTFPAESHVLGDQYLLNLELTRQGGHAGAGVNLRDREGVQAALSLLDEQVTTILVVDDNPNDRRLIRRLLQAYKRYRVIEAHSGAEALDLLQQTAPDLIITDLTMPGMDGFALLDALKRDPATASIPVVVISAKTLSAGERMLLDAQSESVWTKGSFEARQLVDHVVQALGDAPVAPNAGQRPAARRAVARAAAGQTLLVIDDNPKDTRLVRRMLHGLEGMRILEATSGREGLRMIHEQHPDLILLDLKLDDLDGGHILAALRRDPRLREIPVIIYSAADVTPEVRAELETLHATIAQKSTTTRADLIALIDRALQQTVSPI